MLYLVLDLESHRFDVISLALSGVIRLGKVKLGPDDPGFSRDSLESVAHAVAVNDIDYLTVVVGSGID